MPDFQHFRFSYSGMNPSSGDRVRARAAQQPRNPGSDTECAESPDPGCCFGDTGQGGLNPGSLSSSFQYHPIDSLYRASLPPFPPPPPPAAVLRNDLGSNISVLKTLNLRFRCFLAKVHELERRNKALENQLQQALEANNNNQNNNDRGCEGQGKGDGTVQSASLNANDSACLTRTLSGPTQNGTRNKLLVGDTDPNFNLSPSSLLNPVSPVDPKSVSGIRPTYDSKGTERFSKSTSRVLPNSVWFYNPAARFSNSWETRVPAPRVSWPFQDGVGVQIDTITPEIRALNNVLAKVKLERDEYKLRWEEEYAVRVDLQEKMAELEEDLYMSEMCQDKLALQVKQLKAELVVFKGLMSNNLSELDSKIQEKAMRVDMDICRRIDITARLCDVAQQQSCEDMTQIFQVATPPSTLTRCHTKHASQTNKSNSAEDSFSFSESEEGKNKEAGLCGSFSDPVSEEMQRMLNKLHDCEFEDDCDSLAWEETEETLLLWGDFPGCTLAMDTNGEQDESIEKVIKNTESMFTSREKEYQETIGQIEVELATAKSDMTRHLHEYMEMCSMKRGLDVQMETCRRLITQSEDRKYPLSLSVTLEDAEEGEKERKKTGLLLDAASTESCCDNLNNPSVTQLPWRKS